MGDVFLTLKGAHLDTFHIIILQPKVQFTIEHEKNDTHHFLDTLVFRGGDNLSVLVYCKPTHTYQHLNYIYNHQMSCKKSRTEIHSIYLYIFFVCHISAIK